MRSVAHTANSRSPNGGSGCSARRVITEGSVLRARVQYLRHTTVCAHASVRFRPGRESSFRLVPMRHGRLITPMQKMWHGCFMCARSHVLTHAVLGIPGRHRPEGPPSVSQQRSMLKSICLLHLPQRTQHINYEHRDETKGPKSQARQANKNHNQLTSPATTFFWLDALSSARA
jgi:hypothetical protein